MTPTPDDITRLGPGPDNRLEGRWPDRVWTQIGHAELHRFAATGTPRARALVCAGGGYLQLVHDKEGVQVAQWLAGQGIEAHVLVHRLPGQSDGQGGRWPFDVALQDGLAALEPLGPPGPPLLLVGLSSGGHLAGALACQPQALAAGLAGALLAYAPLNANHREHKFPPGKPDYPPPEKQAFYDAWPIGLAEAPHGLPPVPVFLACALHDALVPVEHALRLVRGLQSQAGHVELHVFADAPHGFALRDLGSTHALWPLLAQRWIDERLRRCKPAAQAPT